ncbi:MAG TPA: ATP-dependent helicase [Acidimicrobiales bacterium]|nr:ATP-dependent helicase [Acidimicrobiales bacterium]
MGAPVAAATGASVDPAAPVCASGAVPPERPAWAAGLTDEQRAAVTHDGGPLCILAGAGTGKTATLVARLARLLAEGTPPERVLLVTFSRRAAAEVVRRAGAATDPATAARVHAGTFHSAAVRVLRRHAHQLGLGDGFSVLDQADGADLLRLVRAGVVAEAAAAGVRTRFPKPDTCLAVYSRVVNSRVPLAQVVATQFPWCADDVEGLAEVFRSYTARKRAAGLLDFDDLLLHWRAALADPGLGPVLAGAYDHVLVDEYQDTNLLQADILTGLCRGDARITVVGDDAQAIYGFRAATVRNILDFPDRWPGATTVTLERNFRSTQPILDLANAVLGQMGEGGRLRLRAARQLGGGLPVIATCPDEAAQADAVCDTVLEHLEAGIALRDQAVLARAGHHTGLVELELRRRRIPFVKYGGLRYLEAAHVRDLVALLRLLDNPRDELAWQRVLAMADGVGPAASTRLLAELGVRPADGHDPLARFVEHPPAWPSRAVGDLAALASALADCGAGGSTGGGAGPPPSAQVDRLRRALDPLVRRRYEHAEVRLRDLDRLVAVAASASSRPDLVADLTLDPPTSTADLAGPPSLDDDWLTISTVHSAKGGEWDVVHVVHAADGMFPSDLATGDAEGVDEERRLFYVALTRARRHLHLYAPLRYHHGGARSSGDRHTWAQRTRFLPPEVDHLLAARPVRAAGADEVAAAADGARVVVADAVAADLDALW